ncbi:exosortase/archaeosortase family protein [Sulfuriroseicoccus oceanibius]|uniref:Exosortase/archaeosortase family protein n=1 Tax=Sulfuriroseicoccus oceanibius TaxID=2707525 RepID=A0A6B3L2A1_9BACT|nr:exosortase/archaeosortase family protein [Sulfuriroseicoccus oceanibius]QQL45627.1 exosortase/archaeosortase family protein [Sulfuriroseicoccus oceanibius]
MMMTSSDSNRKVAWGPVAIVLACLVVMFGFQGYATGYMFERDTLASLMAHGYQVDGAEWGFGWFVLPAIAVLLWLTRDRYKDLAIEPSPKIGAALLVLGFFLYFGGYKANQQYFGYAAGQVIAAGCIFWFLGKRWFFQAFWLWCLLGMLWPLRFLIEPVSFPLQLVMVKISAGAFNLLGDPAVANGTAITTTKIDPITGETIRLNVAAACSGLRSLFALTMIGLIFSYVVLKKNWQRVVFMCMVPVFTIAGNFVRMMMLYFGAAAKGSEWAIGQGEKDPSKFHIYAGLAVFVVALLCMISVGDLLNRGGKMFKRRKTVVRSVKRGQSATTPVPAEGNDEASK